MDFREALKIMEGITGVFGGRGDDEYRYIPPPASEEQRRKIRDELTTSEKEMQTAPWILWVSYNPKNYTKKDVCRIVGKKERGFLYWGKNREQVYFNFKTEKLAKEAERKVLKSLDKVEVEVFLRGTYGTKKIKTKKRMRKVSPEEKEREIKKLAQELRKEELEELD